MAGTRLKPLKSCTKVSLVFRTAFSGKVQSQSFSLIHSVTTTQEGAFSKNDLVAPEGDNGTHIGKSQLLITFLQPFFNGTIFSLFTHVLLIINICASVEKTMNNDINNTKENQIFIIFFIIIYV